VEVAFFEEASHSQRLCDAATEFINLGTGELFRERGGFSDLEA
jgi:hypothetical protein